MEGPSLARFPGLSHPLLLLLLLLLLVLLLFLLPVFHVAWYSSSSDRFLTGPGSLLPWLGCPGFLLPCWNWSQVTTGPGLVQEVLVILGEILLEILVKTLLEIQVGMILEGIMVVILEGIIALILEEVFVMILGVILLVKI